MNSFRGILANSTPVVFFIAGLVPATLWLHSTASAGRKIEVSIDGTIYEEVTYELNALNANNITYQKRTVLYSGVSRVRFTGNTGDTYGVV